MLHSRRYWHTEAKTKLCWPNSLSPKKPPKPIVRVYIAVVFTCISHLLLTRFPAEINKYATCPQCKCIILFSWWFLCIAARPPQDKSEKDIKSCSLSYNFSRHWNCCQCDQARLGRASKGRGKTKLCPAALASAALVCLSSSSSQEPAVFRGSCSLQQVPSLLLRSSQGKANKKAWAGWLQDLHGKVLFAHTNTFLNHGCEQLIAL